MNSNRNCDGLGVYGVYSSILINILCVFSTILKFLNECVVQGPSILEVVNI